MPRFESGRRHAPSLPALQKPLQSMGALWELEPQSGQEKVLLSPSVGLVRLLVSPGELVLGGSVFGTLEQLGKVSQLLAPQDAQGQVRATLLSQRAGGLGQDSVAYQTPLLVLDPALSAGQDKGAQAAAKAAKTGGHSFESPSSGRFYRRPSPDKPAFLTEGQIIDQGQTIGMLEIMKTFTRIPFSGQGLPARVKVTQIVAQDEDELATGDVIFHFEPA